MWNMTGWVMKIVQLLVKLNTSCILDISGICPSAQHPLEGEPKGSTPIRSLDYLLSLRMILCLRTWGFRYLLSVVFLPCLPAGTHSTLILPKHKSALLFPEINLLSDSSLLWKCSPIPLAWSTSFCLLFSPISQLTSSWATTSRPFWNAAFPIDPVAKGLCSLQFQFSFYTHAPLRQTAIDLFQALRTF